MKTIKVQDDDCVIIVRRASLNFGVASAAEFDGNKPGIITLKLDLPKNKRKWVKEIGDALRSLSGTVFVKLEKQP